MDVAAKIEEVRAATPDIAPQIAEDAPNLSIHIDGDYLAYFAAGNDLTPAGTARQAVHSRINKLRRITGGHRVVMHLTASNSTKGDRFLIATTLPYQGQRGGTRPVNWEFLRGYLEGYSGDDFEVKLWTQREADDGMAYFANTFAEVKGELHVVHTADKDMRMFAGLHVNWKNPALQTRVPLGSYEVIGADGLLYGHKWFWMQMLKGDTADFIPGLRGVGEKKAEALLKGTTCNQEAYALVSGKYNEVVGDNWPAYFVEQAALLWMRTDRNASLLNFLSLGCFGTVIEDAAHALAESVESKRQSLEELRR